MGGERSREENRRDAEDAWRDIERAVMCLDRERVVNYLKSLYNFTSDKCTRIFIADYLVDEIDDPGYRRLVVEALKNQAATSKCRDQDEDAWDDTRYVSDAWELPEWVKIDELEGLLRNAINMIKRLGEDTEMRERAGSIAENLLANITLRTVVDDFDKAIQAYMKLYREIWPSKDEEEVKSSLSDNLVGPLVKSNNFNIVSRLHEYARENEEVHDAVMFNMAMRLAYVGRIKDALELLKRVIDDYVKESGASEVYKIAKEYGLESHKFFLEVDEVAEVRGDDPILKSIKDNAVEGLVNTLAEASLCDEALKLLVIEGKIYHDGLVPIVVKCYARQSLFTKVLDIASYYRDDLTAAYILLEAAYEAKKLGAKGYEALIDEALSRLSALEFRVDGEEGLGVLTEAILYTGTKGRVVRLLTALGKDEYALKVIELHASRISLFTEELVEYMALGLVERDVWKAIEFAVTYLKEPERRKRVYSGAFRVLAERRDIEGIKRLASTLSQDEYDELMPKAARLLVKAGRDAHVALELLGRVKCLEKRLEGLVHVAEELAGERRSGELRLATSEILDVMRRSTNRLLWRSDSMLFDLAKSLSLAGYYDEALSLARAVKNRDKRIGTGMITSIARAALATDNFPEFLASLKKHRQIMDRDAVRILAAEIAIKTTKTPNDLDKLHREYEEIADCIEERIAAHEALDTAIVECIPTLSAKQQVNTWHLHT